MGPAVTAVDPASLPWTWIAARASGMTAWALLTAVVALGLLLRTRLLGTAVRPYPLMDLHRWVGALALGFLAIHVAALIADPYVGFTLPQALVPFLSSWKPSEVALGIAAAWAMVAVAVASRLRPLLGRRGNVVFRRTHIAAYAAWPLATGHYVLSGTDALAAWSLAAVITALLIVVVLLLARGFVPPARRPAPAGIRGSG